MSEPIEPKFNTDHWDHWLNRGISPYDDILDYYEVRENYLRHGDRLRMRNGGRIFQCLIMPSFVQWTSYEVFQLWPIWPREFGESFLLKTECDPRGAMLRPDDKGYGDVVFLSYSHCAVEKYLVDNILNQFTQPIVPLVFQRELWGRRDGTTYELAISHDFVHEVRYRWWERPSPEWEPLQAGFTKAVEKFKELLS